MIGFQPGRLKAELGGVQVPLPAAWVLFAERKAHQPPTLANCATHDALRLCLGVAEVLQQHSDVVSWVADPFAALVNDPADELLGRRLDGAKEVVVFRCAQIVVVLVFQDGLEDAHPLGFLGQPAIGLLQIGVPLAALDLHDQAAVLVRLECGLAVGEGRIHGDVVLAQYLGDVDGVFRGLEDVAALVRVFDATARSGGHRQVCPAIEVARSPSLAVLAPGVRLRHAG